MEIRIAGIEPESIVDGAGLRYAIFLQGCTRHCKGCHNSTTHALKGGKLVDTSEIIVDFKRNHLLDGITLTGGEPLLQIDAATELAKAAQDWGLNVWLYTGYDFEEIPQELLKYVDVVVDGAYIEELRNLELEFRGSENQRIIKLK